MPSIPTGCLGEWKEGREGRKEGRKEGREGGRKETTFKDYHVFDYIVRKFIDLLESLKE